MLRLLSPLVEVVPVAEKTCADGEHKLRTKVRHANDWDTDAFNIEG
jgi:hypothetical protein